MYHLHESHYTVWGLLKTGPAVFVRSFPPCGYSKDWNEDACDSLLCVRLEINFTELAVNVWCNEYPIPLPNTAAIYKGNVSLRAVYQTHCQDCGLERRVRNVCWISTPCFLNPLLGTVSCQLDKQTPSRSLEHSSMTSDPDELLLDSLTSSSLKKMNEVVKRKESFSRVGRTRDKQKKNYINQNTLTGFLVTQMVPELQHYGWKASYITTLQSSWCLVRNK